MPDLKTKKLAFLGAGKIGEAMIRGLLAAGAVTTDNLLATARRQERADSLRGSLGLRETLRNAEAVDWADLVVVA
ncbi:MAG: NAD(P)-binding domain-containing protein, partial [Candidatus Riflebacteria bacterium]|nr:NAD(P)-binding domain-containing protein [Candidatus Riflebacteria bacterium]